MQYMLLISMLILIALSYFAAPYLPPDYHSTVISSGYMLAAYLLGSIPFGIVISKLFRLGDLRQIGSGNIGATNVLRTGNKWAALLTLLCDAGKGAFIVIILKKLGVPNFTVYLAAAGAVIGHIFPIWLNFQGGKGVATVGGTALALSWPTGLGLLSVWLGAFLISRISSLGAIAAAIAGPILAYSFGNKFLALWFMVISPLVLYRHKDNIQRILQGKEPRFGTSSSKK